MSKEGDEKRGRWMDEKKRSRGKIEQKERDKIILMA